jgi:8-oxo-dGTP diphosphatase
MNIGDRNNIKKRVIAAGAVVVKEDPVSGDPMILLIQRHEDDHWPLHWEFPRGKCNRGEDINRCLKREVKEETGLDVEVIRPIDRFDYLADKGERLTKCYNYLCRMINENQPIRLSKEHRDYYWLNSLGQGELLLMPEQKKTIARILDRDERIINYPENSFTKNNTLEEYLRILQEEPCWKGYQMVGMKKKGGRMVPNCVPIKESKENKPLNKPFRLSGDRKKFGVYVKNDKGNVVLVKFGDPNMEIKRDDPERRKNFRARHNCDNPGPKWKARYWSCRMWEKKKSVGDYLKD